MGVIRSSSAAALVLLTMMVATLVSSETINGDLSRLLRSGRRCKNPEECCRYERLTPEFDQCCMDHGCCPMTCDDYEIGTSVSSDCSKAWSCCRFWPQSDEFKACCGEHGCRPKCDKVSKGCCYNGMMYMFGSLVEDFPMECIQLVCAVQLSPVKPFFSAIIVPVASPLSHTCYERVPCHGTLNCVDHTGLVRAEGDGWYTDQCHYCSCRDGHVECVATPCLPPPHSHCTPVPGDCCPEWNCSAGCEDAAGVFHAIGERWPTDDLCITSVCTMEGTVLEQAVCTQAEPAHADCFQYIPLHECCPKWNCSGCTDSNGTYHSLHEEWKTDPCITLNCTKTGIKTKRLRCPEVPAPHPSCQKSSLPGKCCPGWTCRGCFDTNGTFYELGREWSTGDPCIILVCSARGIVKKAVTCEDVPAPYPTCFKYKPFGECCYKWNCSGCLDNGTYRFVTEVWQRDACTTHVCTTDGIRTTLKNCSLGPAPHSSCQKYTPPGDCCPRWKCSGCVDEAGSYHPMNDAWKTDPCTTHTCTNNGIQTTKEDCNPGHKPYPICQAFIPKGECCSKWNCSGCIDKSRVYHKLQERWNTSRCIAHECTLQGIRTTVVKCTDKPHPNCIEVPLMTECCPKWKCGPDCRLVKCGGPPDTDCNSTTVPLACCPTWNCSGCYDEVGVYHRLGSVWSNPCRTSLCTKAGIRITQDICSKIPRPHPSCVEYTPVGDCCPKWNCSGCVDDYGTLHLLGQNWKTDPCTTHACTATGIQTKKTVCNLGPAPYVNCNQQIGEGECCPKWRCRICVDKQGNDREEGETWRDSQDPCLTCACKQGNSTCAILKCPPPPPWPCNTPPLAGQCCPIYCNNPLGGPTVSPAGLEDCVDKYNKSHKPGDKWLDPSNSCIEYRCGKLGFIQSQRNC